MKQKILFLSTLALLALTCKQANQNKPNELINPQAVYTKDDPGNWTGKEDEHTPKVEILSNRGQDNIHVRVTLNDASPTHFIEKIFIADSKGKPLKEEIFSSTHAKTYTASFTLPIIQSTTKEYAVYARCSQHDLWMAPLMNP